MKKKLFSLLMMVAMVLTALLPGTKTAYAEAFNYPTAAATDDDSTKINITKLVVKDLDNTKKLDGYDGSEITDFSSLGKAEDVKRVTGVYFVAVAKNDTDTMKNFFGDKNPGDGKNVVTPIQPNTTAVKEYAEKMNGNKQVNGSGDGYIFAAKNPQTLRLPDLDSNGKPITYMIYEVKALSDETVQLEKAKAVPIEITLPFYAKDGKTRMGEVFVYPKNTETDINVEKTVQNLETVSDGANVGEVVPWFIQIDLPSDIADFNTFKVTDDLNDNLMFVEGSIKAYVIPANSKDMGDLKADNQVPNNQYDITKTNGQHIEVNFMTGNSNKELAAKLKENPGNKLVVTFNTIVQAKNLTYLDEGSKIKNKATLTYGHQPDVNTHKETEDTTVHVGGKKFTKVDENSNKLPGAFFIIGKTVNQVDYYLVKGTDAKNTALTGWVKASDTDTKEKKVNDGAVIYDDNLKEINNTNTNTVINNPKLVEVSSNSEGIIDVYGLAYGNNSNTDRDETSYRKYFLLEIQAPEGYALPTNAKTEFEVGKDTYTDPGKSKITNRKQTIPETGGIGTIVFTAVGLLLMVTSFVALRRRANHSK